MSTAQTTDYSGSCLCGGVGYTVAGDLSPVDYCHCSQCRKTSEHFVADASDYYSIADGLPQHAGEPEPSK
jgi:hypothetical protein